jgi:hypothetical protein
MVWLSWSWVPVNLAVVCLVLAGGAAAGKEDAGRPG